MSAADLKAFTVLLGTAGLLAVAALPVLFAGSLDLKGLHAAPNITDGCTAAQAATTQIGAAVSTLHVEGQARECY